MLNNLVSTHIESLARHQVLKCTFKLFVTSSLHKNTLFAPVFCFFLAESMKIAQYNTGIKLLLHQQCGAEKPFG